MILRADRGTEDTNIAFLQPFLRDQHDDSFAKERSCQSTSNQVCLNSYLFVSINHVQTRLGEGNSERTLHNGGWIILRCENYSVSCWILAIVTMHTGFERIR